MYPTKYTILKRTKLTVQSPNILKHVRKQIAVEVWVLTTSHKQGAHGDRETMPQLNSHITGQD